MSFVFTPDAGEVIKFLPTDATAARLLHEQTDRFENMSVAGRYDDLDRHLQDYPVTGTMFWVDATLDAMVLRDALKSTGNEAAMLFDTVLNVPVVVTTRSFTPKVG